jgi:flagellar basal-body rod protein FlgG
MPSAALQVARTGLEAQDTRMRVISTTWPTFPPPPSSATAPISTLAYQDTRIAGQQSSNQSAYATGLNLGTGVGVQSTTRDDTQGTLSSTGNSLDVAINGAGYFQVLNPNGTTAYTRAGNFSLSSDGQIVTSQGYVLQPAITIPQGAGSITIASDGTVSAVLQGATATTNIGQITIASFANPTGCRRWATTSIRKPPPAAPRRSACRARRGAARSAGLSGRLERQHRYRTGRHDRMPARL